MNKIIVDERINRSPHTFKQLRPYYTDNYKYRVLARAARTCFRGKSLLNAEAILERWIRKLHAPFIIDSYTSQTWGILYIIKIIGPTDSSIRVSGAQIPVVG